MGPPVEKTTEGKHGSIPTIPEIFKGKCVFVTGATGFLGKVLVEKLLRSCSGIQELCILVRHSGQNASSRIREYIAHPVFDRIRKEQPDAVNKIRTLTGDIKERNLGLTDWHLRKVTSDVAFVFHCAANVRFDEEARDILIPNLVGVQNVLNLCNLCEKLQAVVHVSTAYAFCNQSEITEKVYAELVKPINIIETSQWMQESQLRYICKQYLEGRPVLYHFSKAMAETLIVESPLNFPIIIVRPSVITASEAEPHTGWIENNNGPSGFISLCSRGILRTLLVKPGVHADWVPVDIVANTLIAAAHYMVVKSQYKRPGQKLNEINEVPIINCTCPEENLITWMEVVNYCLPCIQSYPTMDAYDKPDGFVTRYLVFYRIYQLFSHYLPAIIMDVGSCLKLRKPKCVRRYNRLHRVMSYLEYYTTHSFTFRSTNMQKLVLLMRPEDKEIFPIDQRELKWDRYIENFVLGVRRFISKEKEDKASVKYARQRMMKLHCGWMALKLSSWFAIFWLIKSSYERGFSKYTLLLAPMLSSNPFKLKIESGTA